jgi:hypothetical protein
VRVGGKGRCGCRCKADAGGNARRAAKAARKKFAEGLMTVSAVEHGVVSS